MCKRRYDRLNKLCSKEHYCTKECHEPCRLCTVPIKSLLPWGHEMEHACHNDLNTLKCTTSIKSLLSCGQKKIQLCYMELSEVKCNKMCKKIRADCNIKNVGNNVTKNANCVVSK